MHAVAVSFCGLLSCLEGPAVWPSLPRVVGRCSGSSSPTGLALSSFRQSLQRGQYVTRALDVDEWRSVLDGIFSFPTFPDNYTGQAYMASYFEPYEGAGATKAGLGGSAPPGGGQKAAAGGRR